MAELTPYYYADADGVYRWHSSPAPGMTTTSTTTPQYATGSASVPTKPGEYTAPTYDITPSTYTAPTTVSSSSPDNYTSTPIPAPTYPYNTSTYASPTYTAPTTYVAPTYTSPTVTSTTPTSDPLLATADAPADTSSPSLASLLSIISDTGGGGGAGAGGIGGVGDSDGGSATVDTSATDVAGLMAAQDSPGQLPSASLASLRALLSDPGFADVDSENFGIRDRVGVRHGQAIQQARRNFQLSRGIPRAPESTQRSRTAPTQERTGRRATDARREAMMQSAQAQAAEQAYLAQQLDMLRVALGRPAAGGLY